METDRNINTRRKYTWTELRKEISKISGENCFSNEDFSEINNDWEEIESKVWKEFSSSPTSCWLWETLKVNSYSINFAFDKIHFENIIDPNEKLWFLLNETVREKTKFWIYEGTIAAFTIILEIATGIDQVIIVSKKYEWVLIINHHQVLIGTGRMILELHKLEERLKAQR